MKKFLFIIALFFATTFSINAQNITNEQRKFWAPVIDAIEMVESRHNEKAVSSNGKWVGCLQISTILVKEVNRIIGENKFTYNDRYSRQKSHNMFILYQEKYNPERNIEKAVRLWNSGDLKCMQRKASTNGYYNRFKKYFYG